MEIKKIVVGVGIFLSINTAGAYFEDVEVTHPNFYAIDALQYANIVEGYTQEEGEPIFQPDEHVTRAAALKVLMLTAGFDLDDSKESLFYDVPGNAWYAPYINTAANFGVVQGYKDGGFHPAALVTRSEFVKMVAVAFDFPTGSRTEDEEWYEPFFRVAKEYRVLDDESVPAYELLTRGAMAEIIYRAQNVAESGFESQYVFRGSGAASYYGERFHGRTTANGEVFDQNDLTAAHRTFPFGTLLKITYEDKSVVVRVNDRGPYHGRRIIDLSEAAFEKLAPITAGIIWVDIELLSLPGEEDDQSIPEYVRSALESETTNPQVPETVADEFADLNPTRESETQEKTVKKPYFNETVTYLATDFFPNAVLRRPVPQKLYEGTVLDFSGRALKTGYSRARVFLQPIEELGIPKESEEQIHFEGGVSGANFQFPVLFLAPGKYQVGLVFDDEKKSRVEMIEVVARGRERAFNASDTLFDSPLAISTVPEEKEVLFQWQAEKYTVSRIEFRQGVEKIILELEGGIQELVLGYEFFSDFDPDIPLEIELLQARSADGTLPKQFTNWKETGGSFSYAITPGFPDKESEDIEVHRFERFIHAVAPVRLSGRVLRSDIILPENMFFTHPDGYVEEVELVRNRDQFEFLLDPKEEGTYLIEIISDAGEILFNRAIYIAEDGEVLPILPWKDRILASESVLGVRNWTNDLRKHFNKKTLSADSELNIVAQQYAEQMASDEFISHTSPTGMTFEQRIKSAGLKGQYGENLSFGTTLALAVNGIERSGSHKLNMLRPLWGRVGIGLVQNSKGEWYVVQLFGE